MSDRSTAEKRFVRLLASGAVARKGASGDFAIKFEARTVRLAGSEVKALASQGAVSLTGDTCQRNTETLPWLRRQMSETASPADQHRTLMPGPNDTTRNIAESPFLRLSQAAGPKFLAPHQIEAGERVCVWAGRAQLRQRVTMLYDPGHTGGGKTRSPVSGVADMALEARRSLAELYRDLPRDCAEVIIDVCVFEKGLQTIESERGWPRRSAKLVLRIGLEHLAQNLGLAPYATGKPSARLAVWLQPEARPTRFE